MDLQGLELPERVNMGKLRKYHIRDQDSEKKTSESKSQEKDQEDPANKENSDQQIIMTRSRKKQQEMQKRIQREADVAQVGVNSKTDIQKRPRPRAFNSKPYGAIALISVLILVGLWARISMAGSDLPCIPKQKQTKERNSQTPIHSNNHSPSHTNSASNSASFFYSQPFSV